MDTIRVRQFYCLFLVLFLLPIAFPSQSQVLAAQSGSLSLGTAFTYNATLGSAFRLETEGTWQAAEWFALGAGMRFSLREEFPWSDSAAARTAWTFNADAQYLDFAGTLRFPDSSTTLATLGLRIQRSGFPDTSAIYLALVPYACLDLNVFYARLGLSIRDFFDPALPPENNASWEYQLLVQLGVRIRLAGDRLFMRLELNDGLDFDLANLSALNAELSFNIPLFPDWELEPALSLGNTGGTTGAAAFHRIIAKLELRRIWL